MDEASAMTKSRVSTLSHIGIIAKYNFVNYFRARRFYAMLIIVLLVGGLLTFAIGYYKPPALLQGGALGFYAAGWGSFATLLVILSTAFFGGDAVSAEFQNKTGYFLVPNPIRRSSIYVGKWIAALAASTIILALYVLMILGNAIYYFGTTVPSEFLQSVLFGWIYLIAALSLAFAFSSLFRSSAISILMSVIMLLFVFDIIDTVASTLAGIEPWFSITYGAGIISNVLTTPYPMHEVMEKLGPRFSLTTFNATIPEGLAILGVYFVVTAVIGLLLFQRKEFT